MKQVKLQYNINEKGFYPDIIKKGTMMNQTCINKINDVLASGLRNKHCKILADDGWEQIHRFCNTHGHDGFKRYPGAPSRADVIEMFINDMHNLTMPERQYYETGKITVQY